MADKKKTRKRKEEYTSGTEEILKPTKEEYAVAKWMRKNVPTKKTKFLNHNVEYFTAFKAIDALLESQWANCSKEGDVPLFPNRVKVIEFLDLMLRNKFFHRAKKVPVSEQELKARRKDKEKKKDKEKEKEEPDEKKKDETKGTDPENSHMEGKSESNVEKEKRKRKIRLEMHSDQFFEDGMDAYVWMYDPVPVYYWFFGALLVLGAIGICLFPLWPPTVRKGVYYLSIAAAGFLVFIIVLAILRVIVFCLVWFLTIGKYHIWLFPNLSEDVGFFASFWPLYQYEYKGDVESKDIKKKKKKKDKDSDAEEEVAVQKSESIFCKSEDEHLSRQSTLDEDRSNDSFVTNESLQGGGKSSEPRNSESESESSQRSSTGRDFEMLDKDDFESTS